MNVVRLAGIPWEDRINVDNWPSRAGMYYDNRKTELCIRLIDYPLGSVEPRPVHAGTHATTVLKGRAVVDGVTLGSLDVVLGPSYEPHGPLNYPDGCKLLSAFQGSYYHSEVETLSGAKQYRLIQAKDIPWVRRSDGVEVKTLVDRGAGRLRVEAMRFPAGALDPDLSAGRNAACAHAARPGVVSLRFNWSGRTCIRSGCSRELQDSAALTALLKLPNTCESPGDPGPRGAGPSQRPSTGSDQGNASTGSDQGNALILK